MALKAGYVGIKSQLMRSLRDKLLKLDGIIPAGASSENQLATAADVAGRVDWLSYSKTGVHNRLPITLADLKTANTRGTWSGNIYTDSTGVTFTVTEDKGYVTAITANNAASGNVSIFYVKITNFDGKYFVSGCPSGGEWSDNQKYRVRIGKYDGTFLQTDLGNGVEVTFPSGGGAEFQINTGVGYTCNNLTFQLMARDTTDTNPNFGPYAKTNEELTGALAYSESACTDFVEGASVEGGINKIFKFGKVVFMTLQLQSVTAEAWSDIFSIPSGYRPKETSMVMAWSNNSNGFIPISISSSGGAAPLSSLTANKVRISASWITGDTPVITRSAEEPAATTKTTRSKKTKEE